MGLKNYRWRMPPKAAKVAKPNDDGYYRIPHPGLLWNGGDTHPLTEDGGRQRPKSVRRDS